MVSDLAKKVKKVSTHSRLKAAERLGVIFAQSLCFNTQPPEGGCSLNILLRVYLVVSTHSRLKAADGVCIPRGGRYNGFNTQPPEGGCVLGL